MAAFLLNLAGRTSGLARRPEGIAICHATRASGLMTPFDTTSTPSPIALTCGSTLASGRATAPGNAAKLRSHQQTDHRAIDCITADYQEDEQHCCQQQGSQACLADGTHVGSQAQCRHRRCQ